MLRTVLLALLASSLCPAGWKAGVAAVDITPSESIWLAGYASRTKPSESVRQKIYAKALAILDDAGTTSVIITLDLVGIRREMAEAIAVRIEKQHGIPRAGVLFNASHTHSAPIIGDTNSYAYQMGDRQAEYAKVIEQYKKRLAEDIFNAAGNAVKALAPATLHFDQGLAGFAVNRRRVGHREYPGPVDHDVPVLAVKDTSGTVKGILFGYACHNTVMGDNTIHGDYAGYAQHYLQDKYPGAIALFVQGAGADSNPLPRRKPEHLERYGATLADAVEEVIQGKMRLVNGSLKTSMEFPDVRFEPHTKAQFEQQLRTGTDLLKRHATQQLALFEKNGKFLENYPYPVQAWRLGDGFTMIALGGELVVDYAIRFKKAFGPNNTWIAGYSNDVFGYIPSLRVLKEGGYEGGDAFHFSSFPGHFAPDVEDRIVKAVERAVSQVR
jgi:hypothetical protein